MYWSTSGVEVRGTKLREYISGKNDQGKWTKKSRASEFKAKSKAKIAAEQWRAELNGEIAEAEERGESAMGKRELSVADYVDAFIDELEGGAAIEASTVKGYRGSAKFIRAEFSKTLLPDLRADAVARWVASLTKEGKSSSTVGKAFRLLRQAMSDAVNKRVIDHNPTAGVKPPKRVNKQPGTNSLDTTGRTALLQALDNMEATPATVAARIALYTGLREGEICGLQWRDIDTRNYVLWVRRSIGTAEGGCYVKETKTGKVRDVALPPSLAEYLEAYRASKPVIPGPMDYVLAIPGEGYVLPSHVSRTWNAICKALGIVGTEGRPVKFHDLRHTWATLAVAGGVDIKTVSSNLGHANAAMTLNIYASADPDAKRRAAMITEECMTAQTGEVLPLRRAAGGE